MRTVHEDVTAAVGRVHVRKDSCFDNHDLDLVAGPMHGRVRCQVMEYGDMEQE